MDSNEPAIYGEVRIREYSTDRLREAVPDWDRLPRGERLEALGGIQPDDVEKTTNVTTSDLHQRAVDGMDPCQGSGSILTAASLALGTGSTTPTTSDSQLASEVYRAEVEDVVDNGRDLTTTTLIDASEANGNDLQELGLVNSGTGGSFLNRSTYQKRTKNSSISIEFEVELQVREGGS